jgi:hypothetical protein
LLAKKTFPRSTRLSGINPIVHDTPAYECRHHLSPIPAVKHQSIAIMRAIINGKFGKLHNNDPLLYLPQSLPSDRVACVIPWRKRLRVILASQRVNKLAQG